MKVTEQRKQVSGMQKKDGGLAKKRLDVGTRDRRCARSWGVFDHQQQFLFGSD